MTSQTETQMTSLQIKRLDSTTASAPADSSTITTTNRKSLPSPNIYDIPIKIVTSPSYSSSYSSPSAAQISPPLNKSNNNNNTAHLRVVAPAQTSAATTTTTSNSSLSASGSDPNNPSDASADTRLFIFNKYGFAQPLLNPAKSSTKENGGTLLADDDDNLNRSNSTLSAPNKSHSTNASSSLLTPNTTTNNNNNNNRSSTQSLVGLTLLEYKMLGGTIFYISNFAILVH